MLLGWRLEGICNYGGCPHGEGDGDVNRTQGCIELVSESGMGVGTCTTTGIISTCSWVLLGFGAQSGLPWCLLGCGLWLQLMHCAYLLTLSEYFE